MKINCYFKECTCRPSERKKHVACLTQLSPIFDVVTYCDANDNCCHLSHALLSSICASRHGTLYFPDSFAISSCQNHNRIRHIQWTLPVIALCIRLLVNTMAEGLWRGCSWSFVFCFVLDAMTIRVCFSLLKTYCCTTQYFRNSSNIATSIFIELFIILQYWLIRKTPTE